MRRLIVAACMATLLSSAVAGAASPKSWLVLDASETSEAYGWKGGAGTLQVSGPFTDVTSVGLVWTSVVSMPFLALDCDLVAADTFCNFSIGNGDLKVVVTGGTGSDIVSARIGQPNQASTGVGAGGSAINLDWDQDDTLNVFKSVIADAVDFDMNDDGTTDLTIERASSGTKVFRAEGSGGSFFRFATSTGAFTAQIVAGGGSPFNGFLTNLGGGAIRDIAPGATVAGLIPRQSALTTGIGHDLSSGDMTLVRASAVHLRTNSVGVLLPDGLALGLPRSTSPPFVCTGSDDGQVYFDTAGEVEQCNCNGTNWVLASDASTVCT